MGKERPHHHTEKKQHVGKHNADKKRQVACPVLNQNPEPEAVEKLKVRKTHALSPPGAFQILSQEAKRRDLQFSIDQNDIYDHHNQKRNSRC